MPHRANPSGPGQVIQTIQHEVLLHTISHGGQMVDNSAYRIDCLDHLGCFQNHQSLPDAYGLGIEDVNVQVREKIRRLICRLGCLRYFTRSVDRQDGGIGEGGTDLSV